MIGGTWQASFTDRTATSFLPKAAAAMVVLPVFLQAPWVRIHPFSAVLFTAVLLSIGVNLHFTCRGRLQDVGSLLVGFSGSWLAGCLFWGWMRAHPLLHLPIEAFALPLALTGLNGRWRLAAGFYLASLVGTACTDLMMAVTGVMPFWPEVVNAPISDASQLLHNAALQLMNPGSALLLTTAAALILLMARRWRIGALDAGIGSEAMGMAASVLITTLWVDGLFLAAALLQPGLSGLI